MEEEAPEAPERRRQLPWRGTVAVQAALCLALYAAFSLGEPQLFPRGGAGAGGGVDALGRGARGGGVSFLSVAGGSRAPAEQARLLRQIYDCYYSGVLALELPGMTAHAACNFSDEMEAIARVYEVKFVLDVSQSGENDPLRQNMEAIARVYEVKFVLDVSQSGENDPLRQNGSMYSQALNIPWYSTTSSHDRILANFVKKMNMSYDQVLDIIGLDTGALQEPLHDGKISTLYREQTKWLERSLTLTNGNCCWINPLVVCNEAEAPEIMKFYTPFQHIFTKYEVNAYVSTGGLCGYFHRDNSMLYIGHPNHGSDQTGVDGFFLHRVTPLEMESMFINVEGEVVQRSVVHQHGTGAM